jgi:hypothetical protein
MSRRFSRFLGSKWDKVTVKGQPKQQEESSPSSGLATVLLVDDTKGNASHSAEVSQDSSARDTSTVTSKVTTKGNASYSGEVSQDSSAKDTSTDTSKVTLIQDVSRGPPSKSKGL